MAYTGWPNKWPPIVFFLLISISTRNSVAELFTVFINTCLVFNHPRSKGWSHCGQAFSKHLCRWISVHSYTGNKIIKSTKWPAIKGRMDAKSWSQSGMISGSFNEHRVQKPVAITNFHKHLHTRIDRVGGGVNILSDKHFIEPQAQWP